MIAHFLCSGKRPSGVFILQSFCKELPNISQGAPARRKLGRRNACGAWANRGGWGRESGSGRKTDGGARKRGRRGVFLEEKGPRNTPVSPLPLSSCSGSPTQAHNLFLICNSPRGHHCPLETHYKQGWNLSFFQQLSHAVSPTNCEPRNTHTQGKPQSSGKMFSSGCCSGCFCLWA